MLPVNRIPFAAGPAVKSVVQGNTAFALDLYQKQKAKAGSLFFSPYSISTALAMTCAGAKGQTETEMTNALHFNLPQTSLHAAQRELAARVQTIQRWNRITLVSANALWCQNNYAFENSYLDLIHQDYDGEAHQLDFENPSASAREISQWVKRKTSGKLDGGLPAGDLSPDVRLILSSAIYFKGKWQKQFDKKNTTPRPFQVDTNTMVTVPMMWLKSKFKRTLIDEYFLEMVELPYYGGDLSMIILLPNVKYDLPDLPHNLTEFEPLVTPEHLSSWLNKLDQSSEEKLLVGLPRFRIKNSFDLTTDLKSLGMPTMFTGGADFSGMEATTNLYISKVRHEAWCEVNETGTEATAITLAMAKSKSATSVFAVDHPFIFLIRDNGSGMIFFIGRIVDPTR